MFKVRLNTALSLPLLGSIVLALAGTGVLWHLDHQRLLEEHGQRQLLAVGDSVARGLRNFLYEPTHLAFTQAELLRRQSPLVRPNLGPLSMLHSDIFTAVESRLPQLALIGFANDAGGISLSRRNPAGPPDLLVQDGSTGSRLFVFSGGARDKPPLSVIEGYDARSRPFYAPLVDVPQPRWSSIYTNADERAEQTITFSVPVLAEGGRLQGVSLVDITLGGVTAALRREQERTGAQIYLVDAEGGLVAQTSDRSMYQMTDGERRSMRASASDDPFVRATAAQAMAADGLTTVNIVDLGQAGEWIWQVIPFADVEGLRWRTVVGLARQDILGDAPARQRNSLLLAALIALAWGGGGLLLTRLIVRPILHVTDSANRLADDRWDVAPAADTAYLRETSALLSAFERMRTSLRHAFDELHVALARERAAERRLRELNETLEQRVEERTLELSSALENLRRAQDELLQSEKLASLGALVAGVAHELNTPIGNAVTVSTTLVDAHRSFAEQIAGGLTRRGLEEFVADVGEGVQIIERNLERAAELIGSFKRLAVDQTSYQRRVFDLSELVREVMLAMRPTLRRTPFRLDEAVPEGLQLDSYPGPLGQILMNLVNNAVMHAFEGRQAGNIRILAQVDVPGWVSLSVSDDGCGIPEALQKRIFDPFYTTRLGTGGSGLGLHITYRLVTDILGGRIEVQSASGLGASFVIRLPVSVPDVPASKF